MRLVVTRAGEADAMTLRAESDSHDPSLQRAVSDTLRSITKLGGAVELLARGSLPNDGKVIDDCRSLLALAASQTYAGTAVIPSVDEQPPKISWGISWQSVARAPSS